MGRGAESIIIQVSDWFDRGAIFSTLALVIQLSQSLRLQNLRWHFYVLSQPHTQKCLQFKTCD